MEIRRSRDGSMGLANQRQNVDKTEGREGSGRKDRHNGERTRSLSSMEIQDNGSVDNSKACEGVGIGEKFPTRTEKTLEAAHGTNNETERVHN